MRGRKARTFTRQFKLSALGRMEAGENVCGLARELKIKRKLLYDWRDKLRRLGPEGLRGRGRPARTVVGEEPAAPATDDAAARIAELERKIGRQQMELDFFQRALRRVGVTVRTKTGRGGARSTRSSAS